VSDDGRDDPDGNPWPHEPDDSGEVDPQSIGPSVDVPDIEPETDGPSPPDYTSVDVPADLARAFWMTVALVKMGTLAVAVGVMLVGFLGDLRRGGGLVLVGLLAFGLAYRRYRGYRSDDGSAGDGGTRPRPDRDRSQDRDGFGEGADSDGDPG